MQLQKCIAFPDYVAVDYIAVPARCLRVAKGHGSNLMCACGTCAPLLRSVTAESAQQCWASKVHGRGRLYRPFSGACDLSQGTVTNVVRHSATSHRLLARNCVQITYMLSRTAGSLVRFAAGDILMLWIAAEVQRFLFMCINTPSLWLWHRFFYAASVPLLVAAIIYGLSYMPSRRSSWAVKLDVGLAWFSALSVLILVPTDVASTLQVDTTCA